ncbi:outer membrane protein assembly factor BamA [Rhodobacteraceae bacterium N5(2021)]|uniref:Outer membrane protein assembly factor BamA n=1 Tax=Gymnodinialimonas phycosphaerae TaxID=2841589 RepID=A0A975TX59_9RHOB|nr:outer membrane protein assembly factor BamA [Gymnodinialimonas phycosphaerae]MBY4892304.1 outer membrane protein assembly factor BamA [Gymnodinialimonas phycosphaerae]
MVLRALLHLARCVRLFVAPALIVLSLVAVAVPVDAQTFRFNSFDVQGNTRTNDASVLQVAGLSPGTTASAGQVNDALQRLQNSGLFESVEVAPSGNTLVITVVEYPTINRIAIEGNRRLDDDELLVLLESTPRRVFSPITAERDAAAIAEAYRVTGRLTATATPQIIRRNENRVDLVFEVTEGAVVETQRIAFVGNRDYSDRRLRQVLESTQAGLFNRLIRSDTFIEDRIALDRQLLTDFYQDRGYIDFAIQSVTPELSPDRGAYFVTFSVREGQSYRIGNMSVTSQLPGANPAVFQEAINVRQGVRYSPRIIDNVITRMENLASDQGLRFVRIEPVLTRDNANLIINVEFVISRGERVFVERIDIEGNQTTLDRVIRRQFDVVEGDPMDARQIRAAAERIRATGFFADVQVAGRQGTTEEQVIIDVDVEEQPTGSLGFSASYSTDGGAGLAVDFSEENFLGRGQALAVGFNTSDGSQSLNFSFTEPAFLRRDLALGLSAYYAVNQANDSDAEAVTYGAGTSVAFPLSEDSRLLLFYNYDHDELTGLVAGEDSQILIDEPREADTSRVGFTYSFDNRDTGLNPNAGVAFALTGEYAGLGGDTEFVRARVRALAETRVAREEVTLRATFEGGAINGLDGGTRLANRFSLNSRQLRGFESGGTGPRDTVAVGGGTNESALGGNYFAVARFEAAFPIGLPEEYGISGGAFFDVGSVWGLDDTRGGAVDDDLYWRSVVGVSIFWDTALGPLRFNFSHPLEYQDFDRTREFDFTVEARF